MKKFNTLFICSLILLSLVLIPAKSFAAYITPYIEPTYLIRQSSEGEGVKWVQDLLRANGYTITVDGVFGSKTKNAVIHFQKYNNLEADGIVGKLTRNALKESVSYSSKNTSSVTSGTTVINSYMYTSANVNFRNGPSINNLSYGVLAKGSQIYVMQNRNDGWSYVKYNNKYGYISAKYLTYTKPSTSTNSLPAFNRTSTNLQTIIKNCKSYYANNNFYYSLAAGVRSIPADNSRSYSSKYYTDCSTYVSWVLYEYAHANGNTTMKSYFSSQKNSAVFSNIGSNGGNDYLTVVNGLSNAKAGDILVSPGHVEFLSSYTRNSNGSLNIKVYNCGSNSSIKTNGITNSATHYESELTCILRVR